jgi:GTP-binding protein HflX
VVALVGYTNAGKSTLFNRLTRSDVFAKDLLFATLDPTMRRVRLPSGRDIILSDTVGFISDLPTELVAAFRATLEEVLEADLLLHVRDVSHPETDAQKADVEQVLSGLGIEMATGDDGVLPSTGRTILEVLNKIDLMEADQRQSLLDQAKRDPRLVPISAVTGEGCDALLAEIERQLAANRLVVTYHLGHDQGGAVSWLYQHGEVLERADSDESAELTVRLSPTDVERFERLHGRDMRNGMTASGGEHLS